MTAATDLFSADEVARGRAYHRPLYLLLLGDVALSLGLTAFAAFGWLGGELWKLTTGPWWARAFLFTLVLLALLDLARLPLSFWRGHLRERRWGFSTQTWAGWLWDHVKSFAIGYALTAGGFLLLLGTVRVVGGWWPAVAAPGAALLALALGFVAPVLLEPLFNRFRPLDDPELTAALLDLAERAGVPVRTVLVADASRRTLKHNAYVSGLGKTRRVVIFDTMLAGSTRAELEVVVAHELGHRAHRDVAKGTLLAMATAAIAVLVLWALDPTPRRIPLMLFVVGLLELASTPLFAAFSRRLERRADRFALDVTRDPDAFRSAFVSLARANLSDLVPPRIVYAFMFSHPTPLERVASAS
ncbi:MAG: M48 family metallopeptidase [Gaiellaceae bacterium]